jgi:hypothetical protein
VAVWQTGLALLLAFRGSYGIRLSGNLCNVKRDGLPIGYTAVCCLNDEKESRVFGCPKKAGGTSVWNSNAEIAIPDPSKRAHFMRPFPL